MITRNSVYKTSIGKKPAAWEYDVFWCIIYRMKGTCSASMLLKLQVAEGMSKSMDCKYEYMKTPLWFINEVQFSRTPWNKESTNCSIYILMTAPHSDLQSSQRQIGLLIAVLVPSIKCWIDLMEPWSVMVNTDFSKFLFVFYQTRHVTQLYTDDPVKSSKFYRLGIKNLRKINAIFLMPYQRQQWTCFVLDDYWELPNNLPSDPI